MSESLQENEEMDIRFADGIAMEAMPEHPGSVFVYMADGEEIQVDSDELYDAVLRNHVPEED